MGVNIGALVSGFGERKHALDLEDYQREHTRREDYLRFLGQLIDRTDLANDSVAKGHIAQEMQDVLETPPEKRFKPKFTVANHTSHGPTPKPVPGSEEEAKANPEPPPEAGAFLGNILPSIMQQTAQEQGGPMPNGSAQFLGKGQMVPPPDASTAPGGVFANRMPVIPPAQDRSLPAPPPVGMVQPTQPGQENPQAQGQSQMLTPPPSGPAPIAPPPDSGSGGDDGLSFLSHQQLLDRDVHDVSTRAAAYQKLGLDPSGKRMIVSPLDLIKQHYDPVAYYSTGQLKPLDVNQLGLPEQKKIELQRYMAIKDAADAKLAEAKAAAEPRITAIRELEAKNAARKLDEFLIPNLELQQWYKYGQMTGYDINSNKPFEGAPQDPAGNVVGPTFAHFSQPTEPIKTRATIATSVRDEIIPAIREEAAALEGKFGKISGTLAELFTKYAGDHDVAQLEMNIHSLSNFMPQIHALRTYEMSSKIEDLMGKLNQPYDTFVGALDALEHVSDKVAHEVDNPAANVYQSAPGKATPPAAPARTPNPAVGGGGGPKPKTMPKQTAAPAPAPAPKPAPTQVDAGDPDQPVYVNKSGQHIRWSSKAGAYVDISNGKAVK